MKPIYRYAFKNLADTLWYYLDGNDIVQLSATPRYFVDGNQVVSPVNWKDTGVGYTRDDEGHGIFAKFSFPLNFTYEAGRILQSIYTHMGFDGSVLFLVEHIANPEIQVYSEFFKSEIDLSQLHRVIQKNENYTTANVREKGLVQLMKNNSNQTYNVPLDSDSILVNQDGIRTGIEYRFAAQYRYNDSVVTSWVIPITLINDITLGDAFKVNPTSWGSLNTGNGEEYIRNNSALCALLAVKDCMFEFRIDGALFNQAGVDPNVSYSVQLEIYRNNDFTTPVNVASRVLFTSAPASVGNSVTFNTTVNYQYDIEPGDFILIQAFGFNGTGTTTNQLDTVLYEASYLHVTGSIRSIAFDMKALLYPDFLDNFFKIAFGSSCNLVSNFFTADANREKTYGNDPRFVSITSAMEVKGLSRNDIRVAWDDIKKDLQRWGLGWAAEGNNIRIEPASYFYRPELAVYRFNDYESLDIAVDTDVLASRIMIGYDNTDTEITGGVYDYNGNSEYALPVASIKKDVDWTSPFIASVFSIQDAIYYRFENQETKDTEQDDKIYLMSLDPTMVGGKYNLYRPSGTFAGVDYADTLYNYDLTPARSLRFNAPSILTMLAGWDLPSTVIRFAKSDKFSQLYSEFDGAPPVQENADIVLQTLKTQGDETTQNYMLHQPLVIKIGAIVPDNLLSIMEANATNKYGVFEFVKDGQVFGIHVTEIMLIKGKKDIYEVTGKCSRNNDIYKLLK